MKFSSSMIKSFMSCPLQARFAMLDQLPEKGNAAAVFGSCVHISLEYFNLNNEDRAGALGLFSSLWHDPSNAGLQIDVWPKRTSWASYHTRGLKMINDYADSMSWVSRVFVAAEHKFIVPFGNHMLSGIVDLLEIRNNKLYVIDFKSGKRPTYDQLYLDIQFCVDTETEILTRRGWKRHDEILVGEDALTLNQETQLAEWQPVLSVHEFECREQDLVLIEDKGHSSLTTKNHRWPVQHRVYNKRTKTTRSENRIVLSQDLTELDAISCGAPVINLPKEAVYSDEFVELVAWYWTEGHLLPRESQNAISVAQSQSINPEYVDRIRHCLTKLFGPAIDSLHSNRGVGGQPAWRETIAEDCTRFYVNGHGSKKVLEHVEGKEKVVSPFFIQSLTESQLKLFIEISLVADGCSGGYRYITQSLKSRLDSFQMACSLLGIRTSLFPKRISGNGKYAGREFWSLTLKEKEPQFLPAKHKKSSVKHTGLVWCPRTENETWFARRNGQVYFTGNTSYCWAVRQREFWLGNESIDPKYTPVENGEAIWAQLEHMEVVPIWYDLGGNKELNVGHRGDSDFLRLYRCCLEIERAIEKEVFVPNISGSSCVFCPYTEHCHAYIPKSQSGKPII